MAKPTVARVQARANYIEPVTVHFTDGHRLTITPSAGGWGGDAGRYVERIWLTRGDDTVVMFHSPYQYPINHRPFGFTEMAPGYTPGNFAAYWEVAYDHMRQTGQTGRLQTAWFSVVNPSHQALQEVKAGKWPAPTRRRR